MFFIINLLRLGHLPWKLRKHSYPKFEDNPYTQSKDRYNRLISFPYTQTYPSFNWLKASLKCSDFIFTKENLKELHIPCHLLAAKKDAVIGNKHIKAWVKQGQKHSKSKISLEWINDAYHELLSERQDIYEKTYQWIKKNI